MGLDLLSYRSWRGSFQRPWHTIWPIARTALAMIFRRRLFWTLYALSLLIFFMFFFGQYLLAWAESQAAETTVRVGLVRTEPSRLIALLRDVLRLNGTAETYRNFFGWQGSMVMVVLALAGSILVGNDFHFGALPFYLSKPLGRWHYLLGKGVAVAVFINLMTTLPALVLFIQFGLLGSDDYFFPGSRLLGALTLGHWQLELWAPNHLLFGILGYGVTLTVTLSLFLLATATWLRRTVPLIMVWTAAFVFFRIVANALVDGLQYDPRWRLLDLWNDLYLIGSACLGLGRGSFRSFRQPTVLEAALVLGVLCIVCLSYLNHRIRAVEIVR